MPPITVAVVAGDEDHAPLAGTSVSIAVAPTHTVLGPLIGPGDGLTVTPSVAIHPAVVVYVIVVVVPVIAPPVRMPVVAPIVAADVLLLLHVPPVKPGAVSVVVAPAHTAEAPDIAGTALTVIVALPVIVLVQPVVALVAVTV